MNNVMKIALAFVALLAGATAMAQQQPGWRDYYEVLKEHPELANPAPLTVTGVLMLQLPAMSVTGIPGWSCRYSVNGYQATIWLDHACPATQEFR
jgi:hypothetical protein